MKISPKWEFLWISDKKLRAYFCFSCLIVLITAFLNIYLPILARNIVQYITTDYTPNILLIMASLYGVLWTINQWSLTLREIFMIPVSEGMISRLSLIIMKHLHALPYEFHANAQTGNLINQLKRAQIALPNLIWGIFFFTLPPIIEIIGAVSVLLVYNHFLAASLLLLTFIVFMVYTLRSARKSILLHQKSQKFDGDVSAKLTDSLLNFETIKYFGNEEFEYQNYKKYLEEREKAEVASLISLEKVRLIQFLILGLGFISIIFLAARGIINQEMQMSDFVLINGYLVQFFTPLSFLAIIFRNILRGSSDLKLLLKLLDIKPHSHALHPSVIQPLKECSGKIEFKNVCFQYEEKNPVLKNLSFKINPGEKIGFVGPIGSGKSTIAKLLLKLCLPTKGTILIDEQNLSYLTSRNITNHVGIIPQVTDLFNASIAYNIAYGKPDATDQEIMDVTHSLFLDSFITQLPNGYQTVVGEKGVTLSGGQRQSIGVARLVLKKPQIVILDEVTSSLDANSEAVVLKQLQKLCEDKTAIIIAHKLDHVLHCNNIFVLKEGSIVESGTHEALIALNGTYKKMWTEQRKAPMKPLT